MKKNDKNSGFGKKAGVPKKVDINSPESQKKIRDFVDFVMNDNPGKK